MASSIIHLCVAKKLNERINKDERLLFLGSVAPDLAKLVDLPKAKSHFFSELSDKDIPLIDLFLEKYKDSLSNDFNLGYFIHLYTDMLWFKDFIEKYIYNQSIKLKDGTIVETNEDIITNLVYNDYTNLNNDLIEEYNLNLDVFNENNINIKTDIDEIPIYKMNILIDKMKYIIETAKEDKEYLFDIYNIKEFINYSTDKIVEFLEENNIINDNN